MMNITPSLSLRSLIANSGLRKTEIAELVGVTRPTLWLWENGRPVGQVDHVIALARALNCDPVDIRPDLAMNPCPS